MGYEVNLHGWEWTKYKAKDTFKEMDAFTKPIWFNVYKNSVPKCLFYVNFKCAVFKQHRRESPLPFYPQKLTLTRKWLPKTHLKKS